jgi:hypothetical protein
MRYQVTHVPLTEEYLVDVMADLSKYSTADWIAGDMPKDSKSAYEFILKRSTISRAALVHDIPRVAWGVYSSSLMSGIGRVWMLITQSAAEHPMTFVEHCHWMAAVLARQYPIVLTHTFADDRGKWMRIMGFEKTSKKWFGPTGEPFEEWRLVKLRWGM